MPICCRWALPLSHHIYTSMRNGFPVLRTYFLHTPSTMTKLSRTVNDSLVYTKLCIYVDTQSLKHFYIPDTSIPTAVHINSNVQYFQCISSLYISKLVSSSTPNGIINPHLHASGSHYRCFYALTSHYVPNA